VQVEGSDGTLLVLDAGTGIRRLGIALSRSLRRVDILLTHLHMDHIQGLAFFPPLRSPDVEVHIWGPASTTLSLRDRLTRYLSPPLFPIFLRDLGSTLFLHEVPCDDFKVGGFRVTSALVCHPDPTVGYRIATSHASLAYLPDHEPALSAREFPAGRDWTSGYTLAAGVEMLIHDAQYTSEEYANRVGFGHSAVPHTFDFAALTEVKHLVPFHHDPAQTDDQLDRLYAETTKSLSPSFDVTPGAEGAVFEVNRA
jgi:ribonuclease BN (tRNA processing enzyme)